MNRLLSVICCLLWATTAVAEDCRSLQAIDWVLGEWTASPNGVVIREHWHRVSDDTFEGESVAKSLSNDEVVNYETLRLVAMSDGVFYIVKVTDNELPIPFRLVHCSEGFAVFENPQHDAPRRLIYKLLEEADPDAADLEIRLEGDGMNDFSLFFHRQ